MLLPNLLVIGAMKAGTTSLHAYLDQHPDIFMSEVKELDYFVAKKYRKKSPDWYKSQFPTDAKVRGESSQNYTKRHHPDYTGIPERIQRVLPEVKLIYIVRDPIERMRSHYVENYYGDLPRRAAFNQSIGHYEKTSLYYYQLQPYIERFGADQILVVQLEKLQSDRLGEMNRIFRFLEVAEMGDNSIFAFQKNRSDRKDIPFRVKRSLLYRGANRVAPGLARRVFSSSLVRSRFRRAGSKPELGAEEIVRLQHLFRDDVQKLSNFSGLTFESWQV